MWEIKNGKCWAGYERKLCLLVLSCPACAPHVNEQMWFFTEEMKPHSTTSDSLCSFRDNVQGSKCKDEPWQVEVVGWYRTVHAVIAVIGSVSLKLGEVRKTTCYLKKPSKTDISVGPVLISFHASGSLTRIISSNDIALTMTQRYMPGSQTFLFFNEADGLCKMLKEEKPLGFKLAAWKENWEWWEGDAGGIAGVQRHHMI